MNNFSKKGMMLILIIGCSLSTIIAQQKETIVDFSSKQQPDTAYTKPKISINPNTASEMESNDAKEEPSNSITQSSLDSLKRELMLLKKEIGANKNTLTSMQGNLYKAHKKFKLGMYLLIAGSVASSLGNALYASAVNAGLQPSQESALLILGGFGATVTGIVFIFNSNKYIGRAGKGRGERYESYRAPTNYY